METYQDFLQAKMAIAPETGLSVCESDIHPLLKPHQRDIVRWAIAGGRRAIFASFGLGKSVMQLEICRLILAQTGGKGLIVCPLGVRAEFLRDAGMLGTPLTFIRTTAEAAEDGLYLTNYESVREGKIDPRFFHVVSLDEAAILRGFGGTKTFRTFMGMFEGTSTYRFVATAVPSPNDYIELLAYAAFLGIMEVSEGKTRFFKRDSTKADHLTLHKSKEEEWFIWLASWACFVQSPSDLGYDDTGYNLPPMTVNFAEVRTDHSKAIPTRDGQERMFVESVFGVSEAAAEKRRSLPTRIAKMMEIIAESPDDHFMIWVDLESEREAVEKALPSARSVYGTQDLETREQLVRDFAEGRLQYLSSKTSMLGSGVNMQHHCHRSVYVGIDFQFHAFSQSLHRIHRYQQSNPVTVDLIYTEAERSVKASLLAKWERYTHQCQKMAALIQQYGLAHASMASALQRSLGVTRRAVSGEHYTLVNADTVEETASMPDNSVGLIVTSIPFSSQYEYTASYNDFGHNENNAAFWRQMDYLTPQLLRVLQPGRMACIHVKDRIAPGGLTGYGFQTVQGFHCEAYDHYRKHGFAYLGMKTIVTDVVRENNQTYRLGWSEQCKDGSRMGVGMPEYLLLFRKPPTDSSDGYADVPVVKIKPNTLTPNGEVISYDYDGGKTIPGSGYSRGRWQLDAHGFQRASGDRFLTPEEINAIPHERIYKRWREESIHAIYDYQRHVHLCEVMEQEKRLPSTFMVMPPHSWHPDVWTDIARMRTMNMEQERRGQEMHLCPMQFDIAERLIVQLSMPGEVVYDPFGGLMTVPYMAIKLGRYGVGVELNSRYFVDGVRYCQEAERQKDVPTLFDVEAFTREEVAR